MTNRIRDSFEEVRASQEFQEKALLAIAKRRGREKTPKLAWAAAVCCLLLLFGMGGYAWLQQPAAYVSIDVNPSVELTLNRLDRVVSAIAYNEEGSDVLQGVSLKGKTCAEAVDTLLSSDTMQAYLTKLSGLTVTVASRKAEKSSALLQVLRSGTACRKYGGQYCEAGFETLAEAHSYELSFGKYAAYLELAKYDEQVTPEDCHSMNMAEIQKRIRQCRHGGEGSGGGHHSAAGNGGAEESASAAESSQTGSSAASDDSSRGHHGEKKRERRHHSQS